MFKTRNDIKLRFERPKFETKDNKVICTLNYSIDIHALTEYDKSEPRKVRDMIITSCIFETPGCTGNAMSAVGIASCKEGDKFDKKVGREIAEARAEAAAYKHANLLVQKYVANVAKFYESVATAFKKKSVDIRVHDMYYAAKVGGYKVDDNDVASIYAVAE